MNHALEPVVVTGIGVLACNGIGREAFWDALANGRSGIRTIDRFDPEPFPCRIAGQLWDFDPEDFMRKGEVKRWHSHVHQAIASSQLAMDDAEFEAAHYTPERVAVGFGTSVGTPDEHYMEHRDAFEMGGWKAMSRTASNGTSGHSATANVSARFHLRGPATTIASGCSTGLDVLNWGVRQIQSDLADAALVGATESPMTPLMFGAACALGILSEQNDNPAGAMRPFDKNGDGLVLSEGAVAVVLERATAAKERGAQIFGSVVGYGSAAEGNNALIIDKKGIALARAIESALSGAGMQPEDLDCACCHGVAIEMYDRSEVNGYKRALGDHAYRIPMSATKSMTGQAYAAGGFFSVAAALMTLSKGIVPPTINHDEPTDDCDLDFVPGLARTNDVHATLVTALSFGGTHTATILQKSD